MSQMSHEPFRFTFNIALIPYLPVYNALPCIMRTPILDCTLKKKGSSKQRKW